ncbi:MAG: DNA methyltransferase [Candidatus Sulfotelmatobacter sp.]
MRYRPVASLRANPLNPRAHSDRQIKQIARSIEAFGPIVPVLVDQDLQVIAGHGRILAAHRLGLKELPTICIEHLSDIQIRAFSIADNKLTDNSTWDETLLGQQLKALAEVELDFSIEATGFEMGEIDVLIEGLETANDGEADPADSIPDSQTVPVSCLGDLWELGLHRVLCGNALDAEVYFRLMEKRKAELIFTDPPYNVPIDGHVSGLGKKRHANFAMAVGEMGQCEFTDFLSRAFSHLVSHSLDGSMHYVFMDWRHAKEILEAGEETYSELKALCVWVKDNGGMGSLYRSQHELVFVFKNGRESHRNNIQLGQFGRYRTNVWRHPGVNSFSRSTTEGNLWELHPTVKPVGLVADAIMDCSARGGIVLDPFLGSGTTIIAAERTGRICYGIELDPAYVDVVIRRWQNFTGLSAKHSSSGRTFDELEKEVRDERGQ